MPKTNNQGKPKAKILLPVYCSHIELYYVFETSPVISGCQGNFLQLCSIVE